MLEPSKASNDGREDPKQARQGQVGRRRTELENRHGDGAR
jgi:hypothetical protein